ncbi:unnamed protein product, partial [Mesorhabditis belari]|uniref:Lipase n=1 Tax=Mesorhabditis belari TaxID=2138241 RepID=A0AAF3ERM3_9BILA
MERMWNLYAFQDGISIENRLGEVFEENGNRSLNELEEFRDRHGNEMQGFSEKGQILERKDLAWGSFGGKTFPSQRVHKQPVLMIHGVATVAGRFLMLRKYLYNKGYTDAELYATTWGKGPKGGLIFVKMECSFVRQIRTMIEAIKMYTNASKIDIVAFSMGVPLTRKAILGGDCNGFDLGKPLTNWVDTFVSVAGANFGSSMCVYLPWAICNLNNGLNCHSHTLRELNNRRNRYEGAHSFAIITNNDAKVGDWCCGNKCASLPHSLQEFNYDGPTHDEVLYKSIELQYELISRHRGNLSYTNVDKIPNPSPPLSPKESFPSSMSTFEPSFSLLEFYFNIHTSSSETEKETDFAKFFSGLAAECIAMGGLWHAEKEYDYEPPENEHVKTFDE